MSYIKGNAYTYLEETFFFVIPGNRVIKLSQIQYKLSYRSDLIFIFFYKIGMPESQWKVGLFLFCFSGQKRVCVSHWCKEIKVKSNKINQK